MIRALLAGSARNAAYRSTFAHIDGGGVLRVICKFPANPIVLIRQSSEGGVIAMQKVVGSNPFSRFARKPARGAGFRVSGVGRGGGAKRPVGGSLPIRCPFLDRVLRNAMPVGDWTPPLLLAYAFNVGRGRDTGARR
jgi:hypothetical protein